MTPARGCPGTGTGTGGFRAKIARHARFQWRPTNYALNCAKNESELECFMGTLNAIHKAITRLPPPPIPCPAYDAHTSYACTRNTSLHREAPVEPALSRQA